MTSQALRHLKSPANRLLSQKVGQGSGQQKKKHQNSILLAHADVIKWKHFPRYWPFVRGIHRWRMNSPHTKASDAEV